MKKVPKKTISKTPPGEKGLPKELKILGERIKELRIRKGYKSYEVFAFEHNINRTQYGRYERGEDLRYSSLLEVMRALNVTPKEFFETFE